MSEGHWIVNKVIAGHTMAFNMDTLVTMWAAMAFLIVVSFVVTRNISIFRSIKRTVIGSFFISFTLSPRYFQYTFKTVFVTF